MSFEVPVVEGDEPFIIEFGSTVKEAFDLIHQSYPDIKGRFRVITNQNGKETKRDLKPDDSFPEEGRNNLVVFIPAKQYQVPQTGRFLGSCPSNQTPPGEFRLKLF
jgi:hypothetical protein